MKGKSGLEEHLELSLHEHACGNLFLFSLIQKQKEMERWEISILFLS